MTDLPNSTTSTPRRVAPRRKWKIVLAILALALLFPVACNAWVCTSAKPYLYRQVDRVPDRPVGVVLGALVYPGGVPSPVLEERIHAGVALYRAGKVRKLLMSGDNGRREYDEVTAMCREAVRLGVPREDVVGDYAGFRTYDTCYRARSVFGLRSAVMVTQPFHLARAVFTARALGIDAVGYAASDPLQDSQHEALVAREVLARSQSVVDVTLGRKPRFPGPPEPIRFAPHDGGTAESGSKTTGNRSREGRV